MPTARQPGGSAQDSVLTQKTPPRERVGGSRAGPGGGSRARGPDAFQRKAPTVFGKSPRTARFFGGFSPKVLCWAGVGRHPLPQGLKKKPPKPEAPSSPGLGNPNPIGTSTKLGVPPPRSSMLQGGLAPLLHPVLCDPQATRWHAVPRHLH